MGSNFNRSSEIRNFFPSIKVFLIKCPEFGKVGIVIQIPEKPNFKKNLPAFPEAFKSFRDGVYQAEAFSGPKGLMTLISWGRRVRAAKRAMNIAMPVNRPKYILGMKLESTRIEKPMITVIEV